jgi:SAM-dependent methyltransferase
MKKNVFQEYSKYYDLLYRDKDYESEAKYVIRLIRGNAPSAVNLLEFGSGTGKHGRLFAQHGFNVVGIELSDTMTGASEEDLTRNQVPQDGCNFKCVQGDVRTHNLGRIFDSVLALFHVISYQTSNSDILQTFQNAARHLKSGGLFLFDVWHGPAVLTERPGVRIKQVEDEETMLTRIAEPEIDVNAGIVTVRYTVLVESKLEVKLSKFKEEHRMRYLFPTEIDSFAQQSGFQIERFEEFLTGKPASDRTWGVSYLLSRI